MKKIATVQDISCIGKCSLTVALPVISAMGVEACIVPTAVLSTNTLYPDFHFRDLTSDIQPILDHWKRQGFTFDALYTAFLGSFEQIDLMKSFLRDFGRGGALKVVDPCMADDGRFYPGFTPAYAQAMRSLCSEADIIVPNMTEACFLLGRPYQAVGYDLAYIRDMLRALADMGARKVVLKSVQFDRLQEGLPDTTGKMGIMAYDAVTGEFTYYFHEKMPVSFHGTGDIYASVLTGAMVRGMTLQQAYSLAADFVVEAIRVTIARPDYNTFRVDFEAAIPYLIERLGQAVGQ